jgi:Tfp pilus assembly protein PilN
MRKLGAITILLMLGFLLFSCAEKAEDQAQVTALKEQNAELQKQIQELTEQKETPAVAVAGPVTVNWWFAHGGRLG